MNFVTSYAEIFCPIDSAALERPFVIGQLGQSLDGRVATQNGDAANVSGPAGLDHLHHLRARADVVIVGAGTAAADDPRLTVRRVPGANPARAIIDPQGRLGGHNGTKPPPKRWLADDGAKRILITAEGNLDGCDDIIRLRPQNGRLSPDAIVQSLFEHQLRIILIEGGPATLAHFLQAGCLDRLHISISPVIIGSGKAGLDLAPIHSLSEARRPLTRAFHFGNGEVLFDCDMRAFPLAGKR